MVDGRSGKRKKFHDKDKYYRLAKEQGLRSRAAFKLVQINKKFPILESCHDGILDLCAAPGGWTQIAARTCPKNVPIVAVDILPIRSLGAGHTNITTIVGDITTEKCKVDIQKAVQANKTDKQHSHNYVNLVLHDGAPNVGAEYGKDAYQQNELTLHALKCATQHLKPGGHFITKVYRSRDYAALQWLLQQLFDTVQALKPPASRSQSAEIFLICQKYKAPAKLDPRMLDPKHVFEEVAGDSTGGEIGGKALSIFHKNWDKPRRKRGGYDMEHLDATMRHIEPVHDFVAVSSLQAAIQMLSSSTGLAFTCPRCATEDDTAEDGPNQDERSCHCQFYRNHPLTTTEIKACVSDLQVLNKTDFKGLLNWRTKMQEAAKAKRESEAGRSDDDDEDGSDSISDRSELDSEQEEENIQEEIAAVRKRRQQEKKRKKKKERESAAKRRRRAALGMDLNAIDVPEHDKVFSLATITSKGDLEAATEVNLDRITDEQLFGHDQPDDDLLIGQEEQQETDCGVSDEEERRRIRERDLEEAYNQYLQTTKNESAKRGTKSAKRSKKAMRQKVMDELAEDEQMTMAGSASMDYNTRAYAQLLQGPKGSDESDGDVSSSDDDDGYHADPVTPEEHSLRVKRQRLEPKGVVESTNPLVHTFSEETTSARTARWFSNPVFSLMNSSNSSSRGSNKEMREESADESNDHQGHETRSEPMAGGRAPGISAEDVLAEMPKTDKQIRHEKRLKALARAERRKVRIAKRLGDGAEFELDRLEPDSDDDKTERDQERLSQMTEKDRQKVMKARELIKAGMGNIQEDKEAKGIEIVSPSEYARPLAIKDERKYDSEHEDYDSDDYAETLALGTMMLRRSKEKALVDASYNRYAWNDPEGLPDWFVDDESRHYRPQLPIPPALVAKMKERMMAMSTKPIKKVAEARARKNKRAKNKLAAAKRQAEAVANSSEMSEAMKLRAISKALRGQESRKPSKTYVVAKKGRANQGGKGVSLVDKRMKSDKRGLERKEKKGKKGKQNKLVGSKRRRHHS